MHWSSKYRSYDSVSDERHLEWTTKEVLSPAAPKHLQSPNRNIKRNRKVQIALTNKVHFGVRCVSIMFSFIVKRLIGLFHQEHFYPVGTPVGKCETFKWVYNMKKKQFLVIKSSVLIPGAFLFLNNRLCCHLMADEGNSVPVLLHQNLRSLLICGGNLVNFVCIHPPIKTQAGLYEIKVYWAPVTAFDDPFRVVGL